MKHFKLITWLCLLEFTSCIPYKEINIQYIEKPIVNISSDFNKPMILVNFYLNSRSGLRDKFEYAIDSVASEEAALSLKENMLKSPLFEHFEIPIRYYQRLDSSKFIKPLPWRIISSIAEKDSADLVVSLEYMKNAESSDSYKTQSTESGSYYGYVKASIYCYWRIYDLNHKQIPNGYLYKDTLVWDAFDWTPIAVGNQIPGYFAASAYAGSDCGEKYATRISPDWADDKRKFYYAGSLEMEKATEYVYKGQWLEAASEWQKVFALNKRKLSARAAFNLALANEMLGKFDLSIMWIEKASEYYPLPEIIDYQDKLEERIKNKL